MLALKETFLSMYRSSRAIILRFNSKTQWQMFLLLYGRHVLCSMSPFGWYTNKKTWFLARLLIYQSSIVSQTLDFFQWMVTIFILITWLVKTENRAWVWVLLKWNIDTEYSMFATFSRYFECRHCEVQIIAQKMFPFSLLVRGKNYICV